MFKENVGVEINSPKDKMRKHFAEVQQKPV